jgi:hypothetical protein
MIADSHLTITRHNPRSERLLTTMRHERRGEGGAGEGVPLLVPTRSLSGTIVSMTTWRGKRLHGKEELSLFGRAPLFAIRT